MDNGLEKIKQIQSIMFKYNEKGVEFQDGEVNEKDADVQELGFMAEEIEQVFPEMVDMVEVEDKQYRAVAYVKMIPVLLNAIKELNKKVEDIEKYLDTPAKIYYKYEGVSPTGSHKPNTAVPQAFYNKEEGIKKIYTETGAGQWGSSLAWAGQMFGIDIEVFMVKVSFDQKPYRKLMMQSFGAKCHSSPSSITDFGKKLLDENPNNPGSLGIAISDAIESVVKSGGKAKYALGSVLGHVLMHQTINGNEAILQMEQAGDYPDIIIGCTGGGSNLSGLMFPFLGQQNVFPLEVFVILSPIIYSRKSY